MLLSDSRRSARQDEFGNLITLEEQDRTLWNQTQILEAVPLVQASLEGGGEFFGLQAAISALHCQAESYAETDWGQIVGLYDLLLTLQPSPVIQLNREVAFGMANGPLEGLRRIELLAKIELLQSYPPFYASRAYFRRLVDDLQGAKSDFIRAMELTGNDSEKRFFQRRLDELNAL